ncbi:MAG: hypothetical protein K2K32_02205, partial [Muribaculaceae bacterium]|nr:hypothetical protein [Muribaculaceae bacterium]
MNISCRYFSVHTTSVAAKLLVATAIMCGCSSNSGKIDRLALVSRNNPHITAIDTMASLTVGNGHFAFTADITGLQTFPEVYSNGVPLGTMSDWGWHSFPNTEDFKFEETLKEYDFGRGKTELYSVQFKDDARKKGAADYYRMNPHRLHLGALGFHDLDINTIDDIDQTLDMWNGVIDSKFTSSGKKTEVKTSVAPDLDLVAAESNDEGRHQV